MATLTDGAYLNQYVAPQLLTEFRNYNDDFIAELKAPNRSAITADGIRFNKLINNVGFFVNNTADFTAKKMNFKKALVEWEKYDTDPTEVDNAEIRYLSVDKRAAVRVKHSEAWKIGFRDHVLWKLAPDDDTSEDMPVMRTTGDDDGTGRLRLTFANLATYLQKVKELDLPNMNSLILVLCSDHSTDLLLDRDSAKYFADRNIFFDAVTGKVRSMMGFKFYENNATLAYDATGLKLPKGAALTANDRKASLFFYSENTVKHIEKVEILYSPWNEDTRSANPTSEFRLQSYGLVDRIQDYGVGAIVSGIVSAP